MEKRIELEKRGRPANQVTELILDNCRSTNIVGLTDEFTALETLSLINIGLTTLKGFPTLPSLRKLELSDNRISNGLSNLATSPKLTHLNLSGNKIKDPEELKALESFQSLQVLDLFNNETTAIDSYREKIFAMIPSLKYLDGFDINDVEVLSDGDDEDENGLELDNEVVDDENAFSINGLEFDLDELDRYEQRLNAKRLLKPKAKECSDEADDLDDYLSKLVIGGKANQELDDTTIDSTSSQTISKPNETDQSSSLSATNLDRPSVPFAVLLYWMVGLLVFVSSVTKQPLPVPELSDDADGDEEATDDDDDDDEDDEEDDDEELSLAEVYNENLEEDNSDYVEEGEDEEEDDEVDTDDDEAAPADTDAAAAAPEQPAGEESATRGKKRKHDG